MPKNLQKLDRMLKAGKVTRMPLSPEEEKKRKGKKAMDLFMAKDNPAMFVVIQNLQKIGEQLEDLLHTEVPVDVKLPEYPEYPDFPEIPKADFSETNALLKQVIKGLDNQSKKIDKLVAEMQKPIEIELDEED